MNTGTLVFNLGTLGLFIGVIVGIGRLLAATKKQGVENAQLQAALASLGSEFRAALSSIEQKLMHHHQDHSRRIADLDARIRKVEEQREQSLNAEIERLRAENQALRGE